MSRIGKKPVRRARRREGRRRRTATSRSKARWASSKWRSSPRDRRSTFDEAAKQRRSSRRNDDSRQARALHGLTPGLDRATWSTASRKGYEKKLEIVGVGYLAAVQKDSLQLRVGFANEVHLPIPAGLERDLPRPDAHRDQGDRQAGGRPVRRRSARRRASPSRTRARASATTAKQVRRKAGKAVTK